MSSIIPALLCQSLQDIADQLEQIEGATSLVQLDVVDGVYAPHRSWPYTAQNTTDNILSGKEGLPLWERFDFEIDLMVQTSTRDAHSWIQMGASRIVIHRDSPDAPQAIQELQSYREGPYPVGVGLAISSVGVAAQLEPFIPLIDYVQIMGITPVGTQGTLFDVHAIETIQSVHAAYPQLLIQVDGGVKEELIPKLKLAGATRLVVGSAIFTNPQPKDYIKVLEKRFASA